MKYVYPAVFEYDKESDAYEVTFPDLPECFTWGDSIYHAVENAKDVLNLYLWDAEYFGKNNIYGASDVSLYHAGERGFVQYILADTESYHEVMVRENPKEHYNIGRLQREEAAV